MSGGTWWGGMAAADAALPAYGNGGGEEVRGGWVGRAELEVVAGPACPPRCPVPFQALEPAGHLASNEVPFADVTTPPPPRCSTLTLTAPTHPPCW